MAESDTQDAWFLFAYGTLLDPGVQGPVIGRYVAGEADVLEGYRLTSVRDGGETFPNVTFDPDARVPGRVLALSADEMERVDRYEGSLYRRERIVLESGVRAWVYIAP